MTHFGIICPAAAGHLNPMITLGCELQQRGHRVTVINIEDARAKTEAAELEFQAIAKAKYPLGYTKELFTKFGSAKGIRAIKLTIDLIANGAKIFLTHAPELVKSSGIEALLVDQGSAEGGTIAEHLDIPFISLCSAIILNEDITVPPYIATWNYDPSWRGILRNRLGYALISFGRKPLLQVINNYRRQWNLPPCSNMDETYSKLAQISQQPVEFEFPRKNIPPVFHFAGSFNNPRSREPVSFPYEKLTRQPLIYASMGTIQNQLLWIFEMIAEACTNIDAQLVIALGGGLNPESLTQLKAKENTIVVGYAPQLELLQKADLTITHAGMNTTLESLSNGVPMVAIPITNDQPGVAARIAWTGTGEVISLNKVSLKKLRKAIEKVLNDNSYKNNALKLQQAIKKAGGVKGAADLIEQVVT